MDASVQGTGRPPFGIHTVYAAGTLDKGNACADLRNYTQ